MTIDESLQGIVDRMESSHTCIHPLIVGKVIPSNALWSLATAMLQIHNTTTDVSAKSISATAIKSIEGMT